MGSERWQQVTEIFHAALASDPVRREAFLADACGGDAVLRAEVEALVAAHHEAGPFLETPLFVPALSLEPGSSIGSYRIEELLGAGGMGEVYRARDGTLERVVAIKVLPRPFASDPERVARLLREARLLAALNHPNIGAIYGVVEAGAYRGLVLEFVEGPTLADRLASGPLSLDDTLTVAHQIADALAAAHEQGIIHRDLKPANIKAAPGGIVKVLDFGLAKIDAVDGGRSGDVPQPLGVTAGPTRAGVIVGTAAYMSPEQARGKAVDKRTDIWSFGCVLYEMLTGRTAFGEETVSDTIASILTREPDWAALPETTPLAVRRMLQRCLERDPQQRLLDIGDVKHELDHALVDLRAPTSANRAAATPAGRPQAAQRWPFATAGLALIVLVSVGLVIGGLVVRTYLKNTRVNWVEQTAVPEIARLLAGDRPFAALKLYREAERADPASRALVAFSEALYAPPLSIQTTPPGADVYLSDYVDARVGDGWELLGVTPLKTDRIPYVGYYRMRVSKAGFATIERPFDPVGLALSPSAGHLDLTLQTRELTPPGMTWVDAAVAGAPMTPTLFTPTAVPAFWLDTYEVSNRQFKAFVDAGGYRTPANWKEPFLEGGRSLPWETAMARFHDATSRAGPATWQLGSYPEGTSSLPVGGVSWYEAAAYCDFVQKSLPTAYHWYQAAGVGFFSSILQLSNFSGQGPQAVGRNPGLSQYGALDMAGNVKEWSVTPVGTERAILGGSWNESTYTFAQLDAAEPFERRATFGFRCARFVERPPVSLFEPLAQLVIDRRGEKPVNDATFRVYAALHRYDRTDLEAQTKSVDDSKPYFRRETVTFRAAYGDDRVVAHLYLPKNTEPPYQVVLFVPSANNFIFQSIDTLPDPFEFLVRAGRAVLVPAVQGTLERGPSPFIVGPNQMRDRLLQWSKDVQRSIDYLETRPEIDTRKLAFYAISYSAGASPTLLAPESRFKAAVLVSGGTWTPTAAEVDPWNYAPRVKVPVLMLNGRDDFINPVERSQIPLLNALGTPERDKQHVLFDGGHVNLQTRMDLIGEILRWLDRYLGPVTTTS